MAGGAFGVVAGAMGAATLINSRVVRWLGMRTLSHAGVTAFTAVGLVQVGIGLHYQGHPPLVLFLVFEPRGLAAMWLRVKAYFKAWPFSY